MPRLSDLSRRYQNLRAYHGYNYPSLFIAASATKTLAQIGLVAGIAWYGVSLVTQQPAPATANQTAQRTITTAVETNFQIEIPAVSSSDPEIDLVENTAPDTNAVTALPTLTRENKLHTSEWMLTQNPAAFTIQFGTSPDKELLYRSAKSFESDFPVAVFPFKRTPSNRPVYGFTSGIYQTLDEAKQGILELPESAFTFGPWVRPIGKIQKQIKSMSQ